MLSKNNSASQEQIKISVKKLARSLPDFPDTFFQPFVLQKYKKQWQAHLEKISDFLLPDRESGGNMMFKM